MLIYTNVII